MHISFLHLCGICCFASQRRNSCKLKLEATIQTLNNNKVKQNKIPPPPKKKKNLRVQIVDPLDYPWQYMCALMHAKATPKNILLIILLTAAWLCSRRVRPHLSFTENSWNITNWKTPKRTSETVEQLKSSKNGKMFCFQNFNLIPKCLQRFANKRSDITRWQTCPNIFQQLIQNEHVLQN